MVAARTSGPGLSPADLQRIRDTLASGRKPKVTFTKTAGQIAGQIGQIVALTDPDVSDEWVVVRFGRDELPFSPTDLMITKGVGARRPAAAPPPRQEPPMPPPPPTDPPTTPASSPPAPPAGSGPPAAQPHPRQPATTTGTPVPPPSTAGKPAPKPASRKTPKAKPTPTLTVTLTYTEGEWMVAATQGAKTLARPYLVRPAEALRMVSMLDVPGVHEAVEEILEAARAEASAQAERLRAELAEVEARLAELRTTP